MFTVEEEFLSMEELIEESVEIIEEVVKVLYGSIATAAGVKALPKIRISTDVGMRQTAFYSAGLGVITLNAINLQNEDVENIAFVLAHEVYHHKQYEDGERFGGYVDASVSKDDYKNQRIEQEANEFAASLFANVKY